MRRLAALLAALPFVLAACGGDDEKPASSSSSSSGSSSSASGGGGATLKLTAEEPGDEEFAFDPKELSAKAGKVTITLDNPSSDKAPHAIAIDGGATGNFAQPGSKSTVTADLKPGKYTFYCPVGDHREEGMEGTLTVD